MKRITVNFDKQTRAIKAQHGLCNYPVSFHHAEGSGDSESAEKAKALFAEMGVPVTRLKDQMHKGYGKCLEVPYVFRDFSKDPTKAENYYFYNTTNSVKSSMKAGREIMIRLGAPREYWEPIYNKKPDDYDKFAEVCVHIIRHVNDGWAKGLHAGVKYWEIWNRADDKQCWSGGTYEDYYRLYEVVARKIKAVHPRLKVGGPAAADCSGDNKFLKGFLDYVKKNNVPCDFVSWNYYGTDPEEAFAQAKAVRRLVLETKLPKRVEIINDEWNCMTFDENGRFSVPYVRNMHGAAFDAAFMMLMHKARMDFSTYYDCQMNVPWGGLVNPGWVYAYKPLYSFVAFSRLYKLGMAVETKTVGRNVYALAAANEEKKAILVSVYQEKRDVVEINTGVKGAKKVFVLDEKNDLVEALATKDESFTLPVKGYTVLYVEIA